MGHSFIDTVNDDVNNNKRFVIGKVGEEDIRKPSAVNQRNISAVVKKSVIDGKAAVKDTKKIVSNMRRSKSSKGMPSNMEADLKKAITTRNNTIKAENTYRDAKYHENIIIGKNTHGRIKSLGCKLENSFNKMQNEWEL